MRTQAEHLNSILNRVQYNDEESISMSSDSYNPIESILVDGFQMLFNQESDPTIKVLGKLFVAQIRLIRDLDIRLQSAHERMSYISKEYDAAIYALNEKFSKSEPSNTQE